MQWGKRPPYIYYHGVAINRSCPPLDAKGARDGGWASSFTPAALKDIVTDCNSMPATYTVLVFVMGGNSGPWRMNVRGDTLQGYRILPNNNIFASDALVYSTEIRVRGSRFEVYFDQQQHLHDRCNAVYVFVGLAGSGRPINICPEDDLQFWHH